VRDTREALPALVAGAPTGSHAFENRYKFRQDSRAKRFSYSYIELKIHNAAMTIIKVRMTAR
jgi:hypothetical protein